MNFSEWSLEKKFAILSLITFVFIGTVIIMGNLLFAKNQLISAASRYSEAWTNSVIRQQFDDSDFLGVTGAKVDKLNDYFRRNVLNKEIKRVKVWNRQGTVIYSDENTIIKKNFPIGDDLALALNGKTNAEFTQMTNAEQKTEKIIAQKMLEVYIPIYASDNKTVLGAFELYIDDSALSEQLLYNYKVIVISVLGSFAVLYLSLIGIIKKASSTISTQSREINKLYRNLDNSLQWQEKAQTGTIKAILTTLNAKDHYTAGHSLRVAEYAVRIGEAMGLAGTQIQVLRESALFHDIGKVGIAESILNKPGKFTDEEYDLMKKHSIIGADIVSSFEHLEEHAKIIKHHHERIDGAGYPDGLRAQEIPLESRILAVADTYDALTSDRPYRLGMPKEKAIKVILEVKDSQLDAEVVKVFLDEFSI